MVDPVKRTLSDLRSKGAPEFFERDPSKLKALFKAKFEEVSGRTLYPAQTEMFLIEVAAYALSLLNEGAQNGVLQNTVVFSEETHLENRAANVSTYRLLAQPAKTTLEFRLSEVRLLDTPIPAGTRVGAGTAISFTTNASLVIPAGMLTASVLATATAPGAAWNGIGVGAVNDLLDPVPFVSSARNATDVAGGTDAEDWERFRLRAANALFTIAKTGPRTGYREHVMAVDPQIVDVAVIRPQPGRIDIYPLMRTGLPSPELKAAVATYLDPETRRAMGDDVYVLDPAKQGFDITLTVRCLAAVPGLKASAEAAARAAFYPWTQELGAQIAPSVIISAVKAVPGVTDVSTNLVFTDLGATKFAGIDSLVANIVVAEDV